MDGFVLRLNADGHAASTRPPISAAAGHDSAEAIATDGTSFFVTGTTTNGTGFPTLAAKRASRHAAGRAGRLPRQVSRAAPRASFAYSGLRRHPIEPTRCARSPRRSSAATPSSRRAARRRRRHHGPRQSHHRRVRPLSTASPAAWCCASIPSARRRHRDVQTGTRSRTPILTAFPTALSVLVNDVDSHVLAGVTVTFSAPAVRGSRPFSPAATATTDASGIATVNATANGFAGAYKVTATAPVPTGSASAKHRAHEPQGRPGDHASSRSPTARCCRRRSRSATAAASGLRRRVLDDHRRVCTVAGTTVTLVGRGHLRDRRRPGGQRQLQPGAAGEALVPGDARRAVDHLRPARRPHDARDALHGVGDRVLGTSGSASPSPHDHRGARSRARAVTLVGAGRLHDRRGPGGQRHLRPAPQVSALVRGDARGAGDRLRPARRPVRRRGLHGFRHRRRLGPRGHLPSLTAPVCTVSGNTVIPRRRRASARSPRTRRATLSTPRPRRRRAASRSRPT